MAFQLQVQIRAHALQLRQEGLLQAYELPNVDQYFKDVLGDDQGYWTGLTRIIESRLLDILPYWLQDLSIAI